MAARIDNTKQDTTETLSLVEAIKMNKNLKQGRVDAMHATEIVSVTGSCDHSEDRKTTNSNCNITCDRQNKSQTGNSEQVANADNVTDILMSKVRGSSKNLMQTCIDCFQNFFHTLITHKLVQDVELVKKCIDSLILKSEEFSTPFTLRNKTVLSEGNTSEGETHSDELKISLGYVDEKCLETFTSACQLMVEFASFPMYSSDNRGQYGQQAQGKLLSFVCLKVCQATAMSEQFGGLFPDLLSPVTVHLSLTQPFSAAYACEWSHGFSQKSYA